MPLTFITEQNNKGAQQLKLLGAFCSFKPRLFCYHTRSFYNLVSPSYAPIASV